MAKKTTLSGVSANTIYTKTYKSFQGVDFSSDASMVDDMHSPYAKNIISDTGGYPEKRVGWRTLKTLDGRINGIFGFKGENPEGHKIECLIIHAGTKLYSWSGNEADEPSELISDIADNSSHAKNFKGKLCILTGSEYLVFDGSKCVRVDELEDVYAPITHISRGAITIDSTNIPDSKVLENWKEEGSWKDKDSIEVNRGNAPESLAINLVSGKRKNHFSVAGSGPAIFVLDQTIDEGTTVVMRHIATGTEIFRVTRKTGESASAYYVEDDGEINTDYVSTIKFSLRSYRVLISNSKTNNCGYVVCYLLVNSIPGYNHIDGIDDISIEFVHTVEGYAERINKCKYIDVFENRVFFSGNPDYPNADWYSGVNDPLFIPDINYTEIGVSSSEIVGYLKTGERQAILKADGDDATIYMRSYSTLSDGSVIFPVSQGTNGIGAISPDAICTYLDDPLYLTRNGVYAIALQDISSERALNIRSSRINKKLLGEKNLSDAAMCEWNGYLLLCVNGSVYVADAAQKTYLANKTGTYEYEWYYWTNVPARKLYQREGALYFGTEDGRICRFNNDMKNARGELLSSAYSDDGEAIVAEWSTNLSDDGNFMQKKTLVKTGSGIFLKAYNRSGISVCVRTDADFGYEVTNKNTGIFNFEDMDLENFTFNTSPYCVVPLNTRVKKYSAIQIICRNARVNQAFGISGIVRRYFYGKIKK